MEDRLGIVDNSTKFSLTWREIRKKVDECGIDDEYEKADYLSHICEDAIKNLDNQEENVLLKLIENELIQVKIGFYDEISDTQVKFEINYCEINQIEISAIRSARDLYYKFLNEINCWINLPDVSLFWKVFEEITTEESLNNFFHKCELIKTYDELLKQLENWFCEDQNNEILKEEIQKLKSIERKCESLRIFFIQSDKNENERFFSCVLDQELNKFQAKINYSDQNIKSFLNFLNRISLFSKFFIESPISIKLKNLIEKSLKNIFLKIISTTDSIHLYINDYCNLLNQNNINTQEINLLNQKLNYLSENLTSTQHGLNIKTEELAKKTQELNQTTLNLNDKTNDYNELSLLYEQTSTNLKKVSEELANLKKAKELSDQELSKCKNELSESQNKLNTSHKLEESLKETIRNLNNEYVLPFTKMVESKKIIEKNNTSLSLFLDQKSKALKELEVQKQEIEKKLVTEIEQLKKSNDFLSKQLQNSKHSEDIQAFMSQLSELNKIRNKLIEKKRQNKLLLNEKKNSYPDYQLLKELANKLQTENMLLQSQISSRSFIDNLIKPNN